MSGDGLDQIANGEERPQLAELLVDQFAVLEDTRPVAARAVEGADALVFTFTWPMPLVDEMLMAKGFAPQLSLFRADILELIRPALADLVGIEVGRDVGAVHSAVDADPHRATVRFELGERTALGTESIAGVRNWAAHLRRNARRQRAGYERRREELAGRREELRRRFAHPGR